jgi:hypothetical protein
MLAGACTNPGDLAADAAIQPHKDWQACTFKIARTMTHTTINPATVADIAVASCKNKEDAVVAALAQHLKWSSSKEIMANLRQKHWGDLAAAVASVRAERPT